MYIEEHRGADIIQLNHELSRELNRELNHKLNRELNHELNRVNQLNMTCDTHVNIVGIPAPLRPYKKS